MTDKLSILFGLGMLLNASSAAAQTPSPTTPDSRTLMGAPARPAIEAARKATPQTHYGVMSEEVARERLRKLGYGQIQITTSQEDKLQATAQKGGRSQRVEINRRTGVVRTIQ